MVAHASWAGEEDLVKGRVEPLRSQRVSFHGLAEAGLIEGDSDQVHPICISSTASTVLNRVCKSALPAEALACLWGVESGVRIHAAIADARGMLGAGKKLPTNSEDEPAMSMVHLWMADCRNLEGYLIAPTMGKTGSKRLTIALGSLRQDLWTNGTEEVDILHPRVFCDMIRWADTSFMVVGCQTKKRPIDRLVRILRASSKKARKQL
eukprot:2517413-Pyramimonas_sp.AAC.1